MPCIVGCFALLFPRVALVILAIVNLKYLDDAYQTVLWPVLGFFFAPLTTLAYAWAWHYGSGNVNGLGLAIVVVSNWDHSLHERLTETGLAPLVDAAVASAELGHAKPERAMCFTPLAPIRTMPPTA